MFLNDSAWYCRHMDISQIDHKTVFSPFNHKMSPGKGEGDIFVCGYVIMFILLVLW